MAAVLLDVQLIQANAYTFNSDEDSKEVRTYNDHGRGGVCQSVSQSGILSFVSHEATPPYLT